MKIILYTSAFLLSTILVGQKHDNVWVFGYDGIPGDSRYQQTNLNFNSSPPNSISSDRNTWLGATNASISNNNGELLAWSNGFAIYDKNNGIMVNGDSINPGTVLNDYYHRGNPTWYTMLFLPRPNSDFEYYAIHFGAKDELSVYDLFHKFYYSSLDFSMQNGLGEVVEKNQIVDTGVFMPPSACKHANGQDWWIMLPEGLRLSNKKYKYLVTPDTIKKVNVQRIGEVVESYDPGGRKGFSQNGKLYAIN